MITRGGGRGGVQILHSPRGPVGLRTETGGVRPGNHRGVDRGGVHSAPHSIALRRAFADDPQTHIVASFNLLARFYFSSALVQAISCDTASFSTCCNGLL